MISEIWQEYKLSEVVVSANTGLDAIKRAPIVNYDTGIKCLRIQDVSQNKEYKDWGYCEVAKNNYAKFQLRKNDIFIARTGATVGDIKESVQAQLRVLVKRILRKYKYPPDDPATGEYTVSVNKVLDQAELLADYWTKE